MGQQPEPVMGSSERAGLMVQVKSTAGLCKEIPHLTVQRKQEPASSDEEGAWGVDGVKCEDEFYGPQGCNPTTNKLTKPACSPETSEASNICVSCDFSGFHQICEHFVARSGLSEMVYTNCSSVFIYSNFHFSVHKARVTIKNQMCEAVLMRS